MTGAYAHDWPGRGAWADETNRPSRGCGHHGGRGGRHDDPRGERHGRGERGGRPESFPIEALAGWLMSRGAGRGGRHGGRGPSPEQLEKLEAIAALRGMAGFGPGFGPGRGGRGGPRGRGRRRRGDVRLAVLRLLADEPRNGYGLMQAIEDRSGGRWRPSPGSMYPTLSQLEDEGLIRSTEADGGRRFELTDEGRAALAERAGEPDPWATEPDADEHAMSELGPLVVGIGKATWQVASVADETQRGQAAELLAETRRRLYAILAQEPAAGGADAAGGATDDGDGDGNGDGDGDETDVDDGSDL